MFMGKSELANIKNLLKIRLKSCNAILTAGILLGLVFLVEVFHMISLVHTYQKDAVYIDSGAFSGFAFIILLFAIIYYAFQYNEYNENHQIFPHTEHTWFISFELYCYLINLIVQVVAVGLYLLQYLLCLLLGGLNTNVHLAYTFSLSFLTVGFLVNLCYGFLIISFIILVVTLVRRLRYWALAIYVVMLSALWMGKDYSMIGRLIQFYTEETSLSLFFVKIIITWLLIELLNQLLHRLIHIRRVTKFHYPQLAIVSLILITLFFGALTNYQGIVTVRNGGSFQTPAETGLPSMKEPAAVLATDQLPSGSSLDFYYEFGPLYYCNTSIVEENTENDQIELYFSPPYTYRDNINITAFVNPRVTVEQKGNEFHFRVIYDENIKVISISPYTEPMRFDCFKNKNYAKSIYGSSAGSMTGTIKIVLPKAKGYTVTENTSSLQSGQ